MTDSPKSPQAADSRLDLALDQILQNTRPEVAEALLLCAVPRWFDQPLVAALRANDEHSDKILNRLGRFTFTEELDNGRFAYHENVRDRLLVRLEPAQLKPAHERALAEFDRRLADAPAAQQMPLVLERLYHQLVVDRETAVQTILQQFAAAENNYALELCESLVALLRRQPDKSLQDWADYFQSRVDILYRRPEEAGQRLAPLMTRLDELEGDLQGWVQFTFAVTQSLQSHWREAIKNYKRSYEYFISAGQPETTGSIALDIAATYANFFMLTQPATYKHYKTGTARWVFSIGYLFLLPVAAFLTWRLTGSPFGIGPRYFAFQNIEPLYHAIVWYRQALRLDNEGLNFIAGISLARLLMFTGNFDGAVTTAQNLLESPVSRENPYQRASIQRLLANTYLLTGLLAEGERLATASLEIYRQYGDRFFIASTLNVRSLANLLLGRREEARADFRETIAIYRELGNKVALGQILQQLHDLDESLIDELDIAENDRIFLSYEQHRNQRLVVFIFLVILFVVVSILSYFISPMFPFLIGIWLILFLTMWISVIAIIPVTHFLLPLSRLRKLQATLILMDEEKITQLRLDNTVKEEIKFSDIEKISLHIVTYWNKPAPRGSWLKIFSPDREIQANVSINQEFHQLVERLEKRLGTENVIWTQQKYAYFRSPRVYVLAVLYFLLVIFGSTIFFQAMAAAGWPDQTDLTYLLTTLVLLFVFQFWPGLARDVREKRPLYPLFLLLSLAALLVGIYAAWQNETAFGLVIVVLGFGFIVQVTLWVIRLLEWLISQVAPDDSMIGKNKNDG